jgi:hypothetical protein
VLSACLLCSPTSLDTGSVHLISLMWLEDVISSSSSSRSGAKISNVQE